jgi:hypothetical protein
MSIYETKVLQRFVFKEIKQLAVQETGKHTPIEWICGITDTNSSSSTQAL